MTGTSIIVVLIAIGLTIAAHLSQKNAEEKSAWNWVGFAQRHGLTLERGFIRGTYQGYPLAVDTQERRAGKRTYRVTIVHLRLPALPHQATLKRGGLIHRPSARTCPRPGRGRQGATGRTGLSLSASRAGDAQYLSELWQRLEAGGPSRVSPITGRLPEPPRAPAPRRR